MKNPAELSDWAVLTLAQELIRDPKHWTTGMSARGPRGEVADVNSSEVVARCAQGAIMAVLQFGSYSPSPNSNYERDRQFYRVYALLGRYPPAKVPGLAVPQYNDQRQHSDVMDMFDYARSHAALLAL